jgi:hypothetical protein
MARRNALGGALALVLLLAVSVLGASAIAAAPTASTAKPEKITPAGVGKIRLGDGYAALRARHLVGKIQKGCELAGPNARSASLLAPLKGTVDFTMSTPRKVVDVSIRGGAAARGVRVGATLARIKSTFPKARVDHSTDHTFGITLVHIPKNGGGKLEFGVDTKTHKVALIGVPFIAFCD